MSPVHTVLSAHVPATVTDLRRRAGITAGGGAGADAAADARADAALAAVLAAALLRWSAGEPGTTGADEGTPVALTAAGRGTDVTLTGATRLPELLATVVEALAGAAERGDAVVSGAVEAGAAERGDAVDSGAAEAGAAERGDAVDSGAVEAGAAERATADGGSTAATGTALAGDTRCEVVVDAGAGEVRVRCETSAPRVTGDEFATAVADLVEFPDRSLATVRAESAEDRRRTVATWNDTDAPRERPDIVEIIAGHARTTPDAVAVVDGDRHLTYAQFTQAAAVLAEQLRALGIRDEATVGISTGRSAEMLTGILATLIAGGSFVPLDPEWPEQRRASVIADADITVTVTAPGDVADAVDSGAAGADAAGAGAAGAAADADPR
ncbi:AMP-binding protein [Corynebacterium bovis]|uniref:AMP-binding protein n=1 Tax=Corynebacterium bovis TaxID=36808 RepID=UPI0031386A61